MFTRAFWKGTAERAVKTFIQSFLAVVTATVGADAIGVTAGLTDVGWLPALNVALLATVFSVATSIGNADFTAGKTVRVQLDASVVDERIKEAQAEYEAKHLAE